jgi:Lon protease-like protein
MAKPDLAKALEELPLFPLPQAVLFPGATLALHVFEPRYRVMVRDVLASHSALAVVQIADPQDLDDADHPRIADVAGVGIVVDHAELPGGRYNLLLKGHCRVRLEELPFVPPYRRARATPLPVSDETVPQADLAALVSVATRFVSAVREREPSFEFRLPKDVTAAVLADLCAHHLVLDGRQRQRLLETLSARDRVREVAETLAVQEFALQPPDGPLN